MPVNYADVLADLEVQEAKLVTELNTVRAAKPAILAMKQRQELNAALLATPGKYAGLGATAAIRRLLSSALTLMTREEIHDALKAEGWTTKSDDPLSTISATLSQMKAEVEKVGETWRMKTLDEISAEGNRQWEAAATVLTRRA